MTRERDGEMMIMSSFSAPLTCFDASCCSHVHSTQTSDESASVSAPTLPASVLDAWTSLSPDVRAALIATEMANHSVVTSSNSGATNSSSSTLLPCSTSGIWSTGSSSVLTPDEDLQDKTSSCGNSDDDLTNSSNNNTNNSNCTRQVLVEECPESGTRTILTPLERAPKNVFEISKTTSRETVQVVKTASSTVTTKTTVMTTSKGWRNVFMLPISYDVNMVPSGTLLDPTNMQLLDSTGVHPEGYNTRFAVVDAAIKDIYGEKINKYFQAQGIQLTMIIINGGEPDKRPDVSQNGSRRMKDSALKLK
jgi:3-dehydroquinate synthase